MGQILRNWRITLSVLFAVVIIVGSFLLARSVESPSTAQASAESALLQAIAKKDSDGDGLSDWEEALYGTDAHVTDTFHLGMTDGEAVVKGLIVPKAIANIPVATSTAVVGADGLPPAPAAGTLTAAFAQSFFTLYLSAKQANGGADLSESEMANIADEAIRSISSIAAIAPDYRSTKDLRVSGSGVDALKMFAADAEAIMLKNTADATTSEINYLKSAIENEDTTAIPHIASIAKAYRDTAVGLAALQVPQELVAADLALINTTMRLSGIITDFTLVNDDPLAAMLALQQYEQAVLTFQEAFVSIGNVYRTANISLPTGTSGAGFINLISELVVSQTGKNP